MRAQLHHLYHESVSELTGLPGSQSVEDKITEVTVSNRKDWAIIYVDIENFSAYNETYSFLEGDELLKMASRVLKQAVEEAGGPEDLVGHIAGDKFAVITQAERVPAITRTAEALFQENSGDFYSSNDREQGYLVNINRQGLLTKAKLCTLHFDVVTSTDE